KITSLDETHITDTKFITGVFVNEHKGLFILKDKEKDLILVLFFHPHAEKIIQNFLVAEEVYIHFTEWYPHTRDKYICISLNILPLISSYEIVSSYIFRITT